MCLLADVNIAALTDHNSTANCPAFFKACEAVGVTPVAGCELNTAEEVHVLCLFPELDSAMSFGAYLYPHIPDIANDAAIFGRQIFMNENDEETGEERKLLIAATDISIDEIYALALRYGGVAVPAHIDRPAFSLLYNLGFIPEDYPFGAYEVSYLPPDGDPATRGGGDPAAGDAGVAARGGGDPAADDAGVTAAGSADVEKLIAANPALVGKKLIADSDAHMLEALVRKAGSIELRELSAVALIEALRDSRIAKLAEQ
jgi:hypothetical protein